MEGVSKIIKGTWILYLVCSRFLGLAKLPRLEPTEVQNCVTSVKNKFWNSQAYSWIYSNQSLSSSNLLLQSIYPMCCIRPCFLNRPQFQLVATVFKLTPYLSTFGFTTLVPAESNTACMLIILLILDGSQCTKKCHLLIFWIVYECCNKVFHLIIVNFQD